MNRNAVQDLQKLRHTTSIRLPGFSQPHDPSTVGDSMSTQIHYAPSAAAAMAAQSRHLPTATLAETAEVLSGVVVPTVAKGVIIRRPRVVALAERWELDHRAVQVMQKLRDKYQTGPLMLRVPLRRQAVILSPAHVHRVLDNSPEPFATASAEKRAALAHFEPKGALISHGVERDERRRYNEKVLQSDHPIHQLASNFLETVRREAAQLIEQIRPWNRLAWSDFSETWFRIVRLVIFGEPARNDHELSAMMAELRSDANWAFLKPKKRQLRAKFLHRVGELLAQAAPGSLAHLMAEIHITDTTAPSHQVPQWLFAFDPAGMNTFRSLALLATHPEHAARAREEIKSQQNSIEPLPFLRAAYLDSLRLWPTTPMVLRESTRDIEWETGVMPKHTSILIYAPFFHRDDTRLDFANRFAPEIWLDDDVAPGFSGSPSEWPLIPFSSGPAICPGRNLVLLLGSYMLAEFLGKHRFEFTQPDRLSPHRPLPATLNHFTLRFRLVE
jgi:cytochrome P450